MRTRDRSRARGWDGTGGVAAPVNTVAPVLSGEDSVGNVPTLTEATFTGADTITYNVIVNSVAVLSGATKAQVDARWWLRTEVGLSARVDAVAVGPGGTTTTQSNAITVAKHPTIANAACRYRADLATDNGTTLTQAEVDGGTSLTATGANRPTIGATAIDGVAQGIVQVGGGTPTDSCLTGTIAALDAATELTVINAMVSTTANRIYHQVGTSGNSGRHQAQILSSRAVQSLRNTPTGTVTAITAAEAAQTAFYPTVIATRHKIGDDPQPKAPMREGKTLGFTAGGTGPLDTTDLPSGVMWWGSGLASTSPIVGALFAKSVFTRALTDAEILLETNCIKEWMGQRYACEVMWAGDSIPANIVDFAQFRARIDTLYEAEGDGVRWLRSIGSVVAAANPTFTNDRTLTTGGWTIQSLIDQLPLIGYGDVYQPGLVLVLCGTNDADTLTAAQISARMRTLLEDLDGPWNPKIVVFKLCPRPANAVVAQYNALLPGDVAWAVGQGIDAIYSVGFADDPGVTYAVDGKHPDPECGDLIGDLLYPQIRVWAGAPAL